ncbi:MAG: hypothetical protein EOM59_18025 [Clostridia bacterium]|nr:hypothetical protein [Clostridia bacterium]
MPGRDGTGPFGQGSMTGRGLGSCTGVNAPYSGAGRGRFLGRNAVDGFGLGLGLRCRRGYRGYYGVAGTPTDTRSTKEILDEEKGFLKSRLEAIESQLAQWKDD